MMPEKNGLDNYFETFYFLPTLSRGAGHMCKFDS
jgi:hypothetical protein